MRHPSHCRRPPCSFPVRLPDPSLAVAHAAPPLPRHISSESLGEPLPRVRRPESSRSYGAAIRHEEDGNQVRQWSVEEVETLRRKRVGRWSRSDTLGVIGLGVRIRGVFQPASWFGMVSFAAHVQVSSHNHRHGLEVCKAESRAHCFRRNNKQHSTCG